MITGKCLCGAVRWTADGEPSAVHHCHCGMCRRWTGAAFATLVWFPQARVRWEGNPAVYRSSPIALRTHCAACGTALSLAYDARADIALTVGSMDVPQAATPSHHYGVESRLPWADIGADLPVRPTKETW